MSGAGIAVVAGLLAAYGLVGRRADRWNLTAPMVALASGAAVFGMSGAAGPALEQVHLLAEVTLVLVLFHDAAAVRLGALAHDAQVPVRLLAVGFPLAILATFGATWALLPGVGAVGALLIAAAITPTDAGLGAPTVLNPIVPARVRRALNVESGLNDGLATPVVLLCLGALATASSPDEEGTLISMGVVPVVTAVALALAVAGAGGWALDRSARWGWSTLRGRQIAVLMLPLLIFGLAELVGANAFIAAFVGGLAFGAAATSLESEAEGSDLLETTSDILSFGVWFVGGGLLLLVAGNGLRWQWVLLAVLALTVLRVVPVWLSLLGTGFRPPTVLFLGWFGPRGLASVIFALLAVEDLGESAPVIADLVGVVGVTVVLSVIAHGVTAGPLAERYGRWVAATHPPIEKEPATAPRAVRGARRTGH